MVLGFGTKKKKPLAEPVILRTSPSLPEFAQQRIPWPENLVDIEAVHALSDPSAEPDGQGSPQGARRTSFSATRGTVPFHRPFRAGDASIPISPQSTNIATLFGSGVPPPSAFNEGRSRGHAGPYPRPTRRSKHAPTFNVMVAGARQTGKSSLLRLLLDTSTISPTNSAEQLKSLATFRSSSVRPTTDISTASVEILQGGSPTRPGLEDRINLTCIDTPGLDFSQGKEFALDMAVSSVVRYVDLQFADTLGEESKVVRTSKGDRHVHLCIYLIDPDSIMTPSARRARSRQAAAATLPLSRNGFPDASEYDSGVEDEDSGDDVSIRIGRDIDDSDDDDYGEPDSSPVPTRTPLATVQGDDQIIRDSVDSSRARLPLAPVQPDDSIPRASIDPSQSDNTTAIQSPQSKTEPKGLSESQNRLSMSPAEVRVIARLAKRVNVLPIVARADTLTDGRLERIKRAVRRDLRTVGVEDHNGSPGMGLFAVWDADINAGYEPVSPGKENTGGVQNGRSPVMVDDLDDERQSRPVIKLRERRVHQGLTRSRSRKSLKAAVGGDFDEPDAEASPGYAASRPSTSHGPQDAVSLTSPSRRTSVTSAKGTDAGTPSYGAMFSRADLRARMPFAIIAPEAERAKTKKVAGGGSQNGHANEGQAAPGMSPPRFVRRFRWGTVDVLDPQHCDFAALRAAVLGLYMRSLKATTKDVLYERFRTEKLLARRATANISDTERKRLYQALNLKL